MAFAPDEKGSQALNGLVPQTVTLAVLVPRALVAGLLDGCAPSSASAMFSLRCWRPKLGLKFSIDESVRATVLTTQS
jgi:hypothetical protein